MVIDVAIPKRYKDAFLYLNSHTEISRKSKPNTQVHKWIDYLINSKTIFGN